MLTVRAEAERQWAEIDRGVLRLEAAVAQRHGVDAFTPGWRDEYLGIRRESNDEIDSLIAKQHLGEAITSVEQQFTTHARQSACGRERVIVAEARSLNSSEGRSRASASCAARA